MNPAEDSIQHSPQLELPIWMEWTARIVGCTSLIFFVLLVAGNWFLGDGIRWNTGALKGGDLYQHYVAGLMWNEGNLSGLYRNHQLGDSINRFYIDSGFEDLAGIKQFNYVYPPLVGLISALFARLPVPIWLNGWFLVSLFCYLLALWMLFGCKLLPYRPPPSLLLLAAGFPSLFYTQIPAQNSTITLLILASSALALKHNAPWLAGFVFSCAFYKPQLMPYFGLFFLCAGQWKVWLGIGLGSAAWLLCGILLCGWESHLLWLAALREMLGGDQFIKTGIDLSWNGYLRGWMGGTSPPELLGHAIKLGGILATGMAGWAVRRNGISKSETPFWAAAVWLVATSYLGFYDLLLALPLWLLLFQRIDHTREITPLLILLFWFISLCSPLSVVVAGFPTTVLLLVWVLGVYAMANRLTPHELGAPHHPPRAG